MIVVEIKLKSAIAGSRDCELGTMIIGNLGSTSAENPNRGDYSAKMYKKGDLAKHDGSLWELARSGKPTRETVVRNHARKAEPVQNLVAKALNQMGYGEK